LRLITASYPLISNTLGVVGLQAVVVGLRIRAKMLAKLSNLLNPFLLLPLQVILPRLAKRSLRILSIDRVDRYYSDLSGHLSYFAPDSQVGLIYEGVKHSDPRMMLDFGSNVSLATDKWCKERGIPVIRTSIRLDTSNAASTSLVGTTPVLTVSYRSHPNVFCTRHAFLVVCTLPRAPLLMLWLS
jgi:hypothetical protein